MPGHVMTPITSASKDACTAGDSSRLTFLGAIGYLARLRRELPVNEGLYSL
jgi:hypothetical protein